MMPHNYSIDTGQLSNWPGTFGRVARSLVIKVYAPLLKTLNVRLFDDFYIIGNDRNWPIV